ncbi:MAG: hypothetical protein GXP08_08610 [Gammaproteobacteria bacterium]|nr:hypothetical protein [Gammaproteobacteria bacterium]
MVSAQQFATGALSNTIDFIDERWTGGEVKFGDIQIKQQQALIETSLRFQNTDVNISSFCTHLIKQDKGWLVGYSETQKSLQLVTQQHSLTSVIKPRILS